MTRTDRSLKRILIVRTDRLGDVILTLPMFALLRKCFPDAYLAVLLRRYAGEILDGNPYVNEVIWYDRDGELVPFAEMCATLRERRFDAVIVVYPRLRLAWLMFRSRIPIRVGTGYRYYSFLFNRRVYEHRKDARRHELEYNLSLLQQIGCAVPQHFTPEFYIAIPPDADAAIEDALRTLGLTGADLAIVHPGSGGSAREWPVRHFGALAARLTADGFAVIVTGSKEEEEKVRAVAEASGGAAIPMAGAFSIKQLAALIRRAKVFVANSTGPLHLAVAMGTPVVGLYPQHTAMSARRWGPYTDKKAVLVPDRPVECNACVENKTECECMASIDVEMVRQAALKLLDRNTLKGMGVHAR